MKFNMRKIQMKKLMLSIMMTFSVLLILLYNFVSSASESGGKTNNDLISNEAIIEGIPDYKSGFALNIPISKRIPIAE